MEEIYVKKCKIFGFWVIINVLIDMSELLAQRR